MNMIHALLVSLVSTVFNLYLYILILRFSLQLLRADYYNPFTLWIVKYSNPLVSPLQKVLPSWRNVSFAAILAVIIIEFIKILVVVGVNRARLPFNWIGIVYWSAGDILNHVCNIFFFAILIQGIFSWFHSLGSDWISALLYRFTQPLLTPVRRILPPLGGLDLSPIPVLLGLKLLIIYIGYPLIAMGMMLV